MYQGFKDLLSAFHAHSVKYLIVGGYAVFFHAQPRKTKGIDLFVKADQSNARAAHAALAAFGAPLKTRHHSRWWLRHTTLLRVFINFGGP